MQNKNNFNDLRYAKYLSHHHYQAAKCVNLGAAIKELRKAPRYPKLGHQLTAPRVSAACNKNKHSGCTKLNCTCFCHKGGIR